MNDPKRLVIVGCGVVIAILLCLFIKNHADTEDWKRAYKYHIAITAEKQDQFNYDVDSKQGLVLSRSKFETKQGTKFDEMTKTYTYVEKVHEHYTMHTTTYQCGKSTCVRVYYSWDRSGSEDKYAEKTTYFGREYATSIFSFGNLVDTIDACSVTAENKKTGFFDQKHGCSKSWGGGEYFYEDNNDRYYYNTVPLAFTASFLTDTSSGTLKSPFNGRITLETKSTEQMVQDSTGYKFWNNFALIMGAIIMLIAGAVVGYNWVMADGKWSLYE